LENNVFAKVGMSTFTHVGRHARTIRTLLKLLRKEPRVILNLGSGVLEPFLIAEHLVDIYSEPQSLIKAYDSEEQFVDLIHELIHGGAIDLSSLATVAVDRNISGKPILNENFQERLDIGVRDYEDSGIQIHRVMDFQDRTFHVPKNSRTLVKVIHAIVGADLFADTPANSVDLIHAGALFVNILKTQHQNYLSELIRELYRTLHEDGYICIGTSPSYLYNTSLELHLLRKAGFFEFCILAENLIFEPDFGLFGDFAIICTKKADHVLCNMELGDIEFTVSVHPILCEMKVSRCTISYQELIQHFRSPGDQICICAVRLEKNRFETWFLQTPELIENFAFNERVLLNLFRK
jgi:hypothetical protein